MTFKHYLVIRLVDRAVIAITDNRDLADFIAESFPVDCAVCNIKSLQRLGVYAELMADADQLKCNSEINPCSY